MTTPFFARCQSGQQIVGKIFSSFMYLFESGNKIHRNNEDQTYTIVDTEVMQIGHT